MLTQEEFDALPEKAQSAFAKDEESGEYIPGKDATLKETIGDLDKKYKSASQEAQELREKLSTYEDQKRQEIEDAKKQALEQAKSKGDVDEAIKQYEERMSDLQKRADETKTQYEQRIEKLTGTLKSKEKSLIASRLASDMATDVGRDLFSEVVQSRIDVDIETGEPVFLNADGSASSLDFEGFKKELENDKRLKPLLKSGAVTNGGGLANGSNGKGSAPTTKADIGGDREARKAAFKERFNLDE